MGIIIFSHLIQYVNISEIFLISEHFTSYYYKKRHKSCCFNNFLTSLRKKTPLITDFQGDFVLTNGHFSQFSLCCLVNKTLLQSFIRVNFFRFFRISYK